MLCICVFENIVNANYEEDFVIILVSVFKNVYKVFWKYLFENVVWENVLSCEQAFKSSLPTKYGLSYYFPSPLEIVLSIPLVGR